MAGNKNSGRRGGMTMANAEYRMSTIEECWKLVREAINNPELDYKYRVELASRHTVKSIPTEISGDLNHKVTEMPAIQKQYSGEADAEPVNRIAEFDIGSSHPS